ncbi:MAG TPA: hypothetical protein VIO11_01905 [Candidatus Methanoperedens sp.]
MMKSHLAIALGIEAVKPVFLFILPVRGFLIERMKKANSDGLLEDKLKLADGFGYHIMGRRV